MFSNAESIPVLFRTGFGETVSIILFFQIYNFLVSPIKGLIIVPSNTIKLELINKYKEIKAFSPDSVGEFIEIANMNAINFAFEQSTKKYYYILIDEFRQARLAKKVIRINLLTEMQKLLKMKLLMKSQQ